ncbi:MAG: hypothetical protein GY853_01605 [PVC group bacterium]|nr:hypothetical protein [PVC group bacterium]
MRKEEIIIYEFSELSRESQEKAIEKWYELEDYPFLPEDLTEYCKYLLDENNITFDDLKVYYSLSYRQGDGACFIGQFQWKKNDITIKHIGRYSHRNSVNIFFDEGTDEDTEIEFKSIFDDICYKIEKDGYSTLDYRMSIDEFNEHSIMNNYEYLENGDLH